MSESRVLSNGGRPRNDASHFIRKLLLKICSFLFKFKFYYILALTHKMTPNPDNFTIEIIFEFASEQDITNRLSVSMTGQFIQYLNKINNLTDDCLYCKN